MISKTANQIFEGYLTYKTSFDRITKNASVRFEKKQWADLQVDVAERLYLHKTCVNHTAETLKNFLKDYQLDLEKWFDVHQEFNIFVADRQDSELTYTFFSSVTRQILPEYFQTINHTKIFFKKGEVNNQSFKIIPYENDLKSIIFNVLKNLPLKVDYPGIEEDSLLITNRLRQVISNKGFDNYKEIIISPSLFFRNKTAYLACLINITHDVTVPFLTAIVNRENGLMTDALITTSEEIEVIFSFTRSYFCVDVPSPSVMVSFLQHLMPQKRQAEIYNSLGFNKHGKTILFNDLHQFIKTSEEKLVTAPGIKGMVMIVFTFPSFHTVFKIIKDEFDPVKTVTRKEVLEKYRLVYKHDKYGRLADTHEFDNLSFNKDCFSPALLEELQRVAARSIKVIDDKVIIKHTFTERKMIPLNIFIEEYPPDLVHKVVIDFGRAIKELAHANIFPGDILIKNFGVTRDFRVVFYDYDEITFVTACNFRTIPPPVTMEELYASQPLYQIKANDIFPEEFKSYLVPQGELRDIFIQYHADLFEVSFWEDIKQLHLQGYPFEIISYDKKNCLR